jgi:aromatic ring-cleaving dioxygenase
MRNEISTDTIAHVYFLMGKRAVAEKRRREAAERVRRNRGESNPDC